MLRIALAVAVFAAALAALAGGAAGSPYEQAAVSTPVRADRWHWTAREEVYLARYHRVAHDLSWDAAGRNIVDDGVLRADGSAREPTESEVAASSARLRSMLHPAPAPAPAPAGPAAPAAPAAPAPPATTAPGSLSAIAACESGGDYSTDTGNGFYGAYQFTQSTWESVGGTGNPADASPAEQDARAAQLMAEQGTSPWPVCGQ